MFRNSGKGNQRGKEVLFSYIDSLRKKIGIKAIILFGSQARAKQGKRSDYDLLIISDDLPLDYHKRLELLFEEKPPLIDALGFREKEIMDIIHRHFILNAITEGIVIEGNGEFFKKMAFKHIKKEGLIKTQCGYRKE